MVELDLSIGTVLQLQTLAGGGERRYRVTLIGINPARSLVVTAPEVGGHAVPVVQDEPFTVRAFAGTRAIGFHCTALKAATQPYRYLHLSYPDQVQNVQVRSAPRIPLCLPIRLSKGGQEIEGAELNDLGINGAMIETRGAVLEVGDQLQLGFSLSLPDLEPQLLELSATVRGVEVFAGEPARRRCGLQFEPPELRVSLVLRAYVFGHLSGQLRGSDGEAGA